MASGLELITPIFVYQNNPSSKTFLDLLDFLATTSKKITDQDIAAIKSTIDLQIVIDHDGYSSFDKHLWEVLSKFDLSVDWWQYLPNVEGEEQNKTLSLEEQSIIDSIAQNIKKTDELRGVGVEEISLSFFYEVNELLQNSKEFEKLKEYSDELSSYLNEISVGAPKTTGIKPKPAIPPELWDWLFGTICNIYSEFLTRNQQKSENSKNKHKPSPFKATELCVYYNLLLLSCISIHRVSNLQAFIKPLKNAIEQIKLTINSLIKGAIAFCEPEKELNQPLSKTTIEVWTLLVSANFLTSRLDKIISPKAIDVFIAAYIEQSWEVVDEESEELLYQPIQVLLVSVLSLDSEDVQDKRIARLYENDIDLDGIYKYCERNFGSLGKLSLASTKKILFESSLNYWDKSEYPIINRLAKKLVNECNQRLREKGEPLNLELTTRKNDFEGLRPYSAYYESISTLAVVLGQPELGENFLDGNQTKSFVNAAIAVHEAGLTDHAVVLLGYGLVRICSGMIYKSDFSIREVNEFISRPEIMPRVEKLLLPFLELCLKSQGELSNATRMWIKSLNSRFAKAQLHVLEFDNSKVEKLTIDKSFVIPPWFDSDDESLVRALKDMKNLNGRMTEMNIDAWQRYVSAKDLRAKLFEISQSLESTTKKLFNSIYQLFISNQKFNEAIQDLRGPKSSLRIESGGISLGWIEFFMRTIQENSKKNPQQLKKILEIANQEDETIGKSIYQIQASDEALLNSFQHFRNLDNMLSHKSTKSNRHLSQSETNWLYTYAVSDYKAVADLFK